MPEDDWEFFDYLAHGIKLLREAEQTLHSRLKSLEEIMPVALTQLHKVMIRLDILEREMQRRKDA